jgi:hypothetical protein
MGVVAEGGYGTGVNPAGTHFPFISEVSGLERLLADMYLGHRVESAVLPLRLSQIHNMTQPPSGSRADLVVVDDDSNVVFDSTTATDYRTYNFSTRLKIHEWLTDEAVCRVVQHTGQHDSEDVIVYPTSQYPTDAILDERVSELWPKQVYKFKVNNQYISGDVEFLGGYNFTTRLSSINRASGNERTNQIIVSAEGGTGEGFTPGCDEEDLINPPIKRINQVSPTEKGDFVMTANECLSLVNPGTTYTDGEGKKIIFDLDQLGKKGFMLKNSCQPCCTCDDFVNTYKGIQRLYDSYAELGRRSAVLRDKHAENISRWLAQKQCRESSIVKLSVLPFNIREDSCAKIAVGICNSYQACRGEIQLELEFETPTGLSGFINKETVYIYDAGGAAAENYTLEGSWPNYVVRWPVIESQRLAKIKFDIVFSRAPVITWDSQFVFLDGPSGNVVLDGRMMVMLESLSTKDKYSLLITTNKVDAAKTLAAGYRVEDILQKTTSSGISVTTFKSGGFSSKDGFFWEILTNPSSSSVKPYSLRLKYDKSVNFAGKYSGRLYTDSIIPPIFGPKITSADYLTVNATALLNNVPITYGTASTTVGLKVQ